MGSKLYDFLSESFLFNDSLIDEQFNSLSESEILLELNRYREFCLAAGAELELEASRKTSNLKLFSGIKQVDPRFLKQSAFYVEQHILYDPLFEITERVVPRDKAFRSFLGGKETPFNKKRLSQVVSYLKVLTPMVAADYVKLLPTSYFFEPPEQLPFTHSDTGFADVLPEALMKFFHDNAVVGSTKIENGSMVVGGKIELGRGIFVRFKDHGADDARPYLLLEQHVQSVNREKRTVESVFVMPDKPPDKAVFDRWVFQSINQTAEHLYRRVLLENTFAVRFGASYLSGSPFVFRLLEQIVPVESTIQTNTANALMSIELPFIDEVDVETLMKVRRDEGEAFQSFRLELDRHLRELRLVVDPKTLKIKTQNALQEISEVQAHQINQKITYLKKRIFAEATVAAVSLLGAVQSGGLTLPVALLAALQGYKSLAEYQRQKRENPAFFLWKVLKK